MAITWSLRRAARKGEWSKLSSNRVCAAFLQSLSICDSRMRIKSWIHTTQSTQCHSATENEKTYKTARFPEDKVVERLVGNTPDSQQRRLLLKPDSPPDSQLLRVAVIGRPNCGKSTLTNALMGWRVTSVSEKVHTTRKNTMGIFTQDKTQIVFLDTPGILLPGNRKRHKLEKTLEIDPARSLSTADLVVTMVDASCKQATKVMDPNIMQLLFLYHNIPSVLVLNKIDLLKKKDSLLQVVRILTDGVIGGQSHDRSGKRKSRSQMFDAVAGDSKNAGMATPKLDDFHTDFTPLTAEPSWEEYFDQVRRARQVVSKRNGWPLFSEVFTVSSLKGDGVERLKDYLVSQAVSRPWDYHSSLVTDQTPEEVILMCIREKILDNLRNEVPYQLGLDIVLLEMDEEDDLLNIIINIKCATPRQLVTVWYQKLFPAATITRGQLEHKVKMVMASLHLKLDDKEEMEAALSTVVDVNLHDIPKALSRIGLNRSILLSNNYDFVLPTNFVMSNDIVYSLELFRCQEKQTKTFFCEWVKKLFPAGDAETPLKDTQIQYRLQKIVKVIKEYKKNKSTDALNDFLSRPFSDSTPIANTKHRPSGETEALSKLRKLEADHRSLAQALCNKDERIEELNLKVKVVREENKRLQTMKESLQHQEELTKPILAEKNALEKLSKSLKIERDRLKKSKSKSCQRIHLLQKQNKQQKHEQDLLKMEVQRKNLELNDMNRKIQDVTNTRHEEVETEIQMLKKKLKSEQTLKSKYKQKLLRAQALSANLLEEVTNKNEKHVQLKVSCTNKYSDNIRLAYMSLQGEANVAAENVRKAVQIVARYLFSTELRDEDLPSPSSALNFMSEALVISNHHITDSLLSSSHFTYATDGTSRQKKRYLEKHVQLDNGKTLFLGYSEIPSDDSQTLLDTTIQAFKNLAETALDCSEEPHLEEDIIYKEMISKLKCLMSDRAAVMKCFDNKMAAYKSDLLGEETSTHFLFCNAHFLLGLSSAATDAANNMEFEVKGSGTRLGRDNSVKFSSFAQNNEPAVNRALRTTAEVLGPRGDEKSGCREEWLTFLTSRQKTSLFTSYRSNRFNNLFENATALLYHQEDIQAFLTEFCSNSNQKLESILLDISDHNILEFIAALAFYNEMLSTPYWNLMKSSKPYGQFPKYVRLMNHTFQSWMSDDFDLFLSSPVFEDFASLSFILQHLRSGSYDINKVTIFIQQITQQCFIVYERQLHDFLEGRLMKKYSKF